MRVLKSLAILFVFVLIMATVALFLLPQYTLRIAADLEIPEAVVLITPDYCPMFLPWLRASSPEVQSLIWPHLHGMANLEPEDFQKRFEQPGAIGNVLRLVTGRDPKDPEAYSRSMVCLQESMGSLKSQSTSMMALLKNKMNKDGSVLTGWQSTMAKLCAQDLECAKDVISEMQKETNESRRGHWMDVLVEIGAVSSRAALAELTELKNLGMSRDDSDAKTHKTAEVLTQVFVTTQLSKPDDLIAFTSEEATPLPIRWRVASMWAKLEGPRAELWPLAEQVIQSPNSSLNCRNEALLRFGSMWNSRQLLVTELAKQMREVASRLPSNTNVETDFKDTLSAIKAFTNSPREPQAVIEPLAEENQKVLSESVAELAQALRKKYGVNSPALTEFMLAVRTEPLFEDKSSVVTALLNHPSTIDLGMDLLIGREELNGERLAQLRQSFDDLPLDLRVNLVQKAKQVSLIAALLPGLPLKQAQAVWKTQKSESLTTALEAWSQKPGVSSNLKLGFMSSLLARKPDPKKIKKFNELFADDFECEPDWINSAHNLIRNGSTQPGFSTAILSLLKCQPDEVDEKMIEREVLNPKAQAQLKKDLATNTTATHAQINRLTDMMGRANRVSGSTLPAKIKRPGN